MEHARKIVLTSKDLINEVNTNNDVGTVLTLEDVTSRLDNQLLHILNSNKKDVEKWNEYKEVLRRFLFFNNHNNNNEYRN